MKKFLLIWSVILLLIIFQTSLLAPWFADYFYPDLILIAVISAVVVFGFQAVWIWVVVAGATMDVLAYSRIGTHVIIFSLVAYAVSFISRRFSVGDRGVGIVLIVVLMPAITALDRWGMPLLDGASSAGGLFTLGSFFAIGITALENIILFFAFYPILLRIKKKYSPTQYRMNR
jgi:rod shape-determining protein MreD